MRIRRGFSLVGELISYCVVNTDGREHLLRCLEAIEDVHPAGYEREVIVIDNASADGSAPAVVERFPDVRLVARDLRHGKAENDSLALTEARGELCLLLNEDSELQPGSVEALARALEDNPGAGAAGAQLLDGGGNLQPCAWRLPTVATAIASALFLHRVFVTQSGGGWAREVGWAQSAALMVRRSAAAEIGYLDPDFFVYSDETDFCKRLGDAGWSTIYVPDALAVHHEQLANDRSAGAARVIEFHRNRDLYMRKHHGRVAAFIVRLLTFWSYLPRVVAAVVLPGHDPRWFWLHARKALKPAGPGVREAAASYNERLIRARSRA
jgi:GT2 family glycosyltransferase